MTEQWPSEQVLTIRETAAYLKIGESTVRMLIAQGKLGCHRIGRRVLIPYREIEAMLDRGRVPA